MLITNSMDSKYKLNTLFSWNSLFTMSTLLQQRKHFMDNRIGSLQSSCSLTLHESTFLIQNDKVDISLILILHITAKLGELSAHQTKSFQQYSKMILIYLIWMKNTTNNLSPRLLHFSSSSKKHNSRTIHYSENVILDILQANYRKIDSFVASSSWINGTGETYRIPVFYSP